MSEVELEKVYGGEMFKWKFIRNNFYNKVVLVVEPLSKLIPVSRSELFITSNNYKMGKWGVCTIYERAKKIDLPEYKHSSFDDILRTPIEEIHKALLEFHEFCLKTYGSKVEDNLNTPVINIASKIVTELNQTKDLPRLEEKGFYHPYLKNISRNDSEIVPERPSAIFLKTPKERIFGYVNVFKSLIKNDIEIQEVLLEKFKEFVIKYNEIVRKEL